MAIYACSVKVFSRGKGQSAVAAAAYRSGENLACDRDRDIKKARSQSDVKHTEIIAPAGAPDWAQDRAQLWNAAEANETRKDARLAREVLVSLPRELSESQRLELVRGYVSDQFVSRGMVADVAIHEPRASDGGTNPHAHILLTVRGVSGDGWERYAAGGKDQPWNSPARIHDWRSSWETHCNAALEDAGSSARVDARSNQARGLDHAPEPKLGPDIAALEKRGVRTRLGDAQRLARHRRAQASELDAWAKRQREWQASRGDAGSAGLWQKDTADRRDLGRTAGLEVAFNGQMPPELRARLEAMRQAQLQAHEARNRRREGQGTARPLSGSDAPARGLADGVRRQGDDGVSRGR